MHKYIHIPFCKKKCYYCDFTTFEGSHNHKLYFDYLRREEELYNSKKHHKLKTLYFGGGTPSAVDPKYVDDICSRNDLSEGVEVTLEFNPDNFSSIASYNYVNRASIGIQTFDDATLKKIGRTHSSKEAIDFYHKAREQFSNITVDLMFGFPNQSMEHLKRDLNLLKSLDPDHISIYSLIWKENTVFEVMRKRNLIKPIAQDLEADFYEYVIDFLIDLGYNHYEISSFCKKGFESKHNLAYWNNREYIGLGLGASSHYENRRYKNFKSFHEYYSSLDLSKLPIMESDSLSPKEIEEYKIILQLRLLNQGTSGISEENIKKLNSLCEKGLIYLDNGSYKLTKRGLFLSNEVFIEIIS